MYGELLIKNLTRQYFQIGGIFCPKTNNNIYCKKNRHGTAVGIIVVHLFIEFR